MPAPCGEVDSGRSGPRLTCANDGNPFRFGVHCGSVHGNVEEQTNEVGLEILRPEVTLRSLSEKLARLFMPAVMQSSLGKEWSRPEGMGAL